MDTKSNGTDALDDEILDEPRVKKLRLQLAMVVNDWAVTMHALGVSWQRRELIVQAVLAELVREHAPRPLPPMPRGKNGNGRPRRGTLSREQSFSRRARVPRG